MASRENQGLQVALILFVMMTVVLMVTTYVFYRKAEEKTNNEREARQAQTQANQERDKSLFQVQALKFMIGKADGITRAQLDLQTQTDPEIASLLEGFDADMEMYGEGLPEAERNYSTLPKNIIAAIQAKNVAVTDRTAQSLQMEAQLRDKSAQEEQRTAIAVKGQQDTGGELDQERKKFADKVAEFKSQMDESFGKLRDLGGQVALVRKTASDQLSTAQKTITTQENQILTLKDRVRETQVQTPESPDGTITLVNTQARTLWINLGSADGLRTKTSFSVYPHGETSLQTARQKGRVEVISILDQHLAEARVVEEIDVSDPIVPGDVVFSPVWRSGSKLHFALAGFMDLDGDGRSDRSYIRSVITINGGVIDAELHDDGTPQGRVTEDTRYLVMGARPDEDPSITTAFRDEFGRITGDAARNGVSEITVSELLKLMGWKPEVRRVTLGSGARAGDDGDFRERRPGAAGANGSGDSSF